MRRHRMRRDSFQCANILPDSEEIPMLESRDGKESHMHLPATLVLFAALSASAAAATQDTGRVPRDVRRLVERFESCVHFAGEFNGDGSVRDREVNATMTELRCDRVEQDAAALRVKYARHPRALKALDAINGF